MLFDSLQKIKKLPSSIKIYPGHGAGSSCGKTIDEGNHCFLNIQLERNFALKADNRE
jgi:hydroxyacylglutathione hydrolase